MHGVRRSIALGLLLGCAPACDDAEDPGASAADETGEAEDELEQGISPSALRWVLDWDSGDELEIVNDLGYRVHVDAGWIGSWGMTLVECLAADASPNSPAPEPGSSTGELELASPWLVAEGHSTGADDPSAWVFAGVESLTEAGVVTSESLELTPTCYCQAHYLIGPLSEASEGFAAAEAALTQIDPELSLAGASVVIVGSWEPPGGGEATPFVLRSEQSYGKILELELAVASRELDDAAIEVEILRDRGSMFDAIDFASASSDDASWQLLGNLAKQARAEARIE